MGSKGKRPTRTAGTRKSRKTGSRSTPPTTASIATGPLRELPREMPPPEEWDDALSPAQKAFLSLFVATGNVAESCAAVGISRSTAYRWQQEEKFAEAMTRANVFALENLESAMYARAVHGLERMKFHEGQAIIDPRTRQPYIERVYSDLLMIFLAKARSPKYRDGADRAEGEGTVYRDVLMIPPREGDAPGQPTLPV